MSHHSTANACSTTAAASSEQAAAIARRAACGKAIIVGEHAVVYGAEAVAIPVTSLVTELTMTPSQHDYRLQLGSLPLSSSLRSQDSLPLSSSMPLSRQHLQHLKEVVFDAFKVLQIHPFPLSLKFRSNSLMGAGLGSSAALSVALIRLLGEWAGRKLTDFQVARLANYLERRFHGNPSGLDTAVSACAAPILFQKNRRPQKINIAPLANGRYPWQFVLIDSGVRASTLAMINRALPWFQRERDSLKIFSQQARMVAKALARGKFEPVAMAMNRVDTMLRAAGVTTAHLIDIIDSVKALGVPAAKSTGAGGGGCVLSLLHPQRAQEQLQKIKHIYGTEHVYEIIL